MNAIINTLLYIKLQRLFGHRATILHVELIDDLVHFAIPVDKEMDCFGVNLTIWRIESGLAECTVTTDELSQQVAFMDEMLTFAKQWKG